MSKDLFFSKASDRRTGQHFDGHTDIPSCRDARTHLKTGNERGHIPTLTGHVMASGQMEEEEEKKEKKKEEEKEKEK